MLECLYTAFGIQRSHDALFGVTVLQLFGNTPGEVIEAALLVNVTAKMVYHMAYPNYLTQA
mgnify:CR=1 FL=1